jgi:multiple sugar transport system substrate-binding protein
MSSNKLTRREVLRLGAGLTTGAMAATWLAACAPASSPAATGGQAQAPAAERTQVRVQASANPSTLEITRWAADRHMELFPDVEVVLEETIYNEIARKTETGFVAGTLQDVCYGHLRWFWMGCHRGIYTSLEDYIASDPPEDFEDFFPLWMEVNKFEGVQYQLPESAKPGPVASIIYNKQILEEAGLDEPTEDWTWLDLFEMARKATNVDEGIFGVSYRFFQNDIHSVSNVARYFEEDDPSDTSGSLIVDEGTRFRLDTPAIQEAMRYTLSLMEERVFPKPGDDVEGGLFAAGKLAFQLGQVAEEYSSNLARVGGRFEIGHLPPPKGPKGAWGTVNVGNQWMINSASNVKDAAWEVLKTFTGKEAAIEQGILGDEPGRRSGWVDPRVVEATPMLSRVVSLMDNYLEDFPMPSNLRYVEANSVFVNEFALVLEGEVTLDEYAPTIVEQVQAIVDLERPSA